MNLYENFDYYILTQTFLSYFKIFSIWNSNDIFISLVDENSSQRELLRGYFLLMKKLGFEGSKESEK